jgi:hypothetical protein
MDTRDYLLAASHWQTLSLNSVSGTPRPDGIRNHNVGLSYAKFPTRVLLSIQFLCSGYIYYALFHALRKIW